MERQGSNRNAMDLRPNENNQFKTEALECESEEWMEECRSILNSDEPISFQDLLTEGGVLATPHGGNGDTEMLPQMNSEVNTAASQNNDGNRGKKIIINLEDECEDGGFEAIPHSHKRKSPEGSSRRMFLGETSRTFERREVSQEDLNMVNSKANFIDLEQPDVQVQTAQPQNVAGNGTVVHARTVTVPQIHHNSNQVGQGWAPQRNILVSNQMGQGWAPQRNIQHGYSFVLCPPFSLRNRPPQPTQYYQTAHVPIRPNMLVPPPIQPFEMPPQYHPVYYDADAQPIYQLNRSPNFDFRNNAPMPGIQIGNPPTMPTNMIHQMYPGNVASSSSNPPAPLAYRPSSFAWNPQGNFVDQFSLGHRPPVQAVNNQVEPWRPPYLAPAPTASVVRPSEIRAGARNDILWPEVTMATLRQAGLAPDVALNLMTATERTRLLNEIRNAIRLLRGNLNVVQVEFNNLVGQNADEHGDMRLDVDEYSYEELLVLEQSIGNVSTGLAEDVIDARLRSRKYRTAAFGSPSKNPPCCICQEEYVDGEDTAKLICGHYFHFNCIKQWLKEKNNCPICKSTAVNV